MDRCIDVISTLGYLSLIVRSERGNVGRVRPPIVHVTRQIE
jgi:hypothetical protein